MSWQAVQWAMKRPCLTPTNKLVLIYLADHAAQDGGSAYPSLATLASRSGLSERTVRRALAELVTSGAIEVESTGGRKGGRGLSTRYRLPLSASLENPAMKSAFATETRTNPTQKADSVAPQPKKKLRESPPDSFTLERDPAFATFYAAYPRKVARPRAEKAWRQVLRAGARPTEIMAGLLRFAFSDDPKFIPYPESWLNGERWRDVPQERPHNVAIVPPHRESPSARRRRLLGIVSPLEFEAGMLND